MKKTLLTLVLTLIGIQTTFAQIGIGTTSPDASAQLELQSTAKGFLPPRMDTDARDGIGSPAEGLTIYNTDNKCLEVFDNADWISICDGSVVTSPTPTLIGANGVVWMDRNLGANQVAESSTDHLAYGDIYQWGRFADGHEKITWISSTQGTSVNGTTHGQSSSTSPGVNFLRAYNTWYNGSIPDPNSLWQGVNGINNPCPSGYRLPTDTEWEAERTSWIPSNATGAFTSLKLPMAGYRLSDGNLYNQGSDAYYWSSTVSDTERARNFYFRSDYSTISQQFRANGNSIRCIKD